MDYCSYSKMEKDIYMRYSSDVFSYATDDERSNNYSFMCSQMKLQTNLWKNDVRELMHAPAKLHVARKHLGRYTAI